MGRWVVGGWIVLFFVLQFVLSLRYNLNWDEYFFLSRIYEFQDGRMSDPMQTFHVEILQWLTWLPVSEPDQLVIGRLFMMVCEAGSLVCVYFIARQFVSDRDALFAVAAWCATAYSLVHGASFRADPLAGFTMMASLAILVCRTPRWHNMVLAGAFAALGLVITIKSALYLPAFLGAFVWNLKGRARNEWPAVFGYFAIAGLAVAITFLLLFWMHAGNLPEASPGVASGLPTSQSNSVMGTFDKVVLSQDLFPRSAAILRWASQSIFPLALFVLGLWAIFRRGFRKGEGAWALAVLLFAVPLLCLVFYRNAFAYFFPFIMLPSVVVAGVGSTLISRPLLRHALMSGMIIVVLIRFVLTWPLDQVAQRQVAATVHLMFPEPVPYIDRNGMIPSFPKVGFFMSTLWMERYLAGQAEPLEYVIRRDQPPLLLLNSPFLEAAVNEDAITTSLRLSARDSSILRENFIEHWGPVWVAGKILSPSDSQFEIVIGGAYTIECVGDRVIDEEVMPCGSVIELDVGSHGWGRGAAILRWGDNLPRPDTAFPESEIYYGF